jgi:hypothetical protein
VCTFIHAVLPAGADIAAVSSILQAHGRACTPIVNAGLRLEAGEQLCSTTVGHCDCGTPLASSQGAVADEKDAQWRDRMRRKGWSPARIARADMQRRAAAERPVSPRTSEVVTSLPEWRALIEAVLQSRATASFGVFVESSDRGHDQVVVRTPDRERVRLASLDEAMLESMRQNVIHEFRR